MKSTNYSSTRMSIATARATLGEVFDKVRHSQVMTILTSHGKDSVVIVSVEFYMQALEDRARLEGLEK